MPFSSSTTTSSNGPSSAGRGVHLKELVAPPVDRWGLLHQTLRQRLPENRSRAMGFNKRALKSRGPGQLGDIPHSAPFKSL